jgi:hypothetical protein
LGFLQKLVPHRSLTLPFEPFHFWLRIREIFVIEKRLPDSPGVADSPPRFLMFKRKLSMSESWGVAMVSRGVAMVSRGVAIRILENLSSL